MLNIYNFDYVYPRHLEIWKKDSVFYRKHVDSKEKGKQIKVLQFCTVCKLYEKGNYPETLKLK